jgi:hypothetical protein
LAYRLSQVQRQHAGQDQQVVLAGGDLHRVGVAHGEPPLGDRRHRLVAAPDGEFVVEQVSLHLQVVGTGDVDGEPVSEGREEALADLGGLLASQRDLVGRPQRHQLALDLRHLPAVRVAQVQPVAQAEHLCRPRGGRVGRARR